MFNKYYKSLSIGVLAALLIGMLVLALPTGSVSAQTPQPQQPKAAEQQANRISRLERMFRMEQRWLERQAANLERSGKLIERAQALIDRIKEKGGDPASLVKALAEFKANIAEAQVLHDQAAAVLKGHAGFDANGKVTDVSQAWETVKEAGKDLRAARKELGDGYRLVLKEIEKWRRQQRPAPTASVNP